MSQQEILGHDSHYVFAIIKKRVIKSALPNLRGKKTKGELLFLIVLIILASFGGTMGGFQVDQHFINPPMNVIGVCSPPAVLTSGGCYIIQTSVDNSGKQVTTKIPSGSYYLPNGTTYSP